MDTTVMPKAVAHPTDSRLLERSRQHPVKLAADNGLMLRQNYNREAPRIAMQVGRYAHAKQFRRMKKSLRTLTSRVGRVYRVQGITIKPDDRQRRARLKRTQGDAFHEALYRTCSKIKPLIEKSRCLITLIDWAIGSN